MTISRMITNSEERLNFGKYAGMTIIEVAEANFLYIKNMQNKMNYKFSANVLYDIFHCFLQKIIESDEVISLKKQQGNLFVYNVFCYVFFLWFVKDQNNEIIENEFREKYFIEDVESGGKPELTIAHNIINDMNEKIGKQDNGLKRNSDSIW